MGSNNRSIPGLRGERRTGRSLVLGCRLTETQCDPGCLRANFAQESGERASGGARNSAVQPSAVQGVGDRASSRVTLLPPFFLPLFSCSSTPAPSLHLRLSRPPPPPPLASFSRLASIFRSSCLLPHPWSLAGSPRPIQQNFGTHPHLNRYC